MSERNVPVVLNVLTLLCQLDDLNWLEIKKKGYSNALASGI